MHIKLALHLIHGRRVGNEIETLQRIIEQEVTENRIVEALTGLISQRLNIVVDHVQDVCDRMIDFERYVFLCPLHVVFVTHRPTFVAICFLFHTEHEH